MKSFDDQFHKGFNPIFISAEVDGCGWNNEGDDTF